MAFEIIIDGYNLIRKFPPLSRVEAQNFSRGREVLLDWLTEYRRQKPHPITVVFDGGKGGGFSEERDFFKGIQVLYSQTGQTADDIIKRLVSKSPGHFLVVTSDVDLGSFCRARSAGWISSEEFSQRIQKKSQGQEKEEDQEGIYSRPGKKKGLSRRPSKQKKSETRYWGKI
jgi:hypothetical protein